MNPISSRKKKSADFHQRAREWDQRFKELNLERPQDQNQDLLFRARQINFGLLEVKSNPNWQTIATYQANPELYIPKNNFKCYPDGGPTPKWVDTPERFQKLVDRLQRCDEFTIDLEMHNHRTMTDFVSLIQIGTWEFGDYLIDPFKVRDQITSLLKPIVESPDYLKIGHDLTNDVKWLQKDFGIYMAAAIDTQIMYRLLHGEKQIGFTQLVLNYHPELKSNLTKETMSDWRLRPGKGMTKDQEIYATNDVHILLRVFDELRSEMSKKKSGEKIFSEAIEDTKLKLQEVSNVLKDPLREPDYKTDANQALLQLTKFKEFGKRVSNMTDDERKIFTSLIEWRALLAKIIDEKPTVLVCNKKLLSLSQIKEPTVENIKKVLGVVDKRIYDHTSDRAMQAGVVKKLIETNGDYIDDMRQHECHNCLNVGHGPAWACPFPKNKENYKKWYKRPENKEAAHYQFNRRLENLIKSKGEEAAHKVINSTKTKKN